MTVQRDIPKHALEGVEALYSFPEPKLLASKLQTSWSTRRAAKQELTPETSVALAYRAVPSPSPRDPRVRTYANFDLGGKKNPNL